VYEPSAWNCTDYGRIKGAVSLLEQVVKIQKLTQLEGHPKRLALQHALAMGYEANRRGQGSSAIVMYGLPVMLV